MIDVTRTELIFGRMSNPAHYQRPKLTTTQRDEVGYRLMDGESVRDLAAEYRVNTSVIRCCTPKERPL